MLKRRPSALYLVLIAELPIEAALDVLPQVGFAAGFGDDGNSPLHVPLEDHLSASLCIGQR